MGAERIRPRPKPMQIAPDNEKNTEDDIEYDVAASMRDRFPCVDDLLLELVQKGIILLLLAELLIVAIVLWLYGLVLVSHLNIIIEVY